MPAISADIIKTTEDFSKHQIVQFEQQDATFIDGSYSYSWRKIIFYIGPSMVDGTEYFAPMQVGYMDTLNGLMSEELEEGWSIIKNGLDLTWHYNGTNLGIYESVQGKLATIKRTEIPAPLNGRDPFFFNVGEGK